MCMQHIFCGHADIAMPQHHCNRCDSNRSDSNRYRHVLGVFCWFVQCIMGRKQRCRGRPKIVCAEQRPDSGVRLHHLSLVATWSFLSALLSSVFSFQKVTGCDHPPRNMTCAAVFWRGLEGVCVCVYVYVVCVYGRERKKSEHARVF